MAPRPGQAELESVLGVAATAAVAEQDFQLAVDSLDLGGRGRGPAHRPGILPQRQIVPERLAQVRAPRGKVAGVALAGTLKLGLSNRLAPRGLDSAPATTRIAACCHGVAGVPECLGTLGAGFDSISWRTLLFAVTCHG